MFVSNKPTGADITLSKSQRKRKERSPSTYRDIAPFSGFIGNAEAKRSVVALI